ncbi:MAG: LPS export ABC transporter periplasmic protein LptC [Bdellovibrionales bacterium]|nr:LPS export ABC transporter periplasmic protein LptC [Bdellovibrionales bacterium]
MKLTKLQSKLLATGILVLFFAVGIGFLNFNSAPNLLKEKLSNSDLLDNISDSKNSKRKSKQKIEDISIDFKDKKGSAVVLGKFERSESLADGRPLWEIKANTGRYYPEGQRAEIENADMKFYKKNGRTVTLETKKADVYLDGNILKSAHVYGGVTLNLNKKTTIKTKEADYDKQNETITTDKRVDIFHEMMETSGNGLEGNIKTQEFKLLKNVNSVIKPRKE